MPKSSRVQCYALGLKFKAVALLLKNMFLLHKIFYNFIEKSSIDTKLYITLENRLAHAYMKYDNNW